MCFFTRVRHALPEPSPWRRAGWAAGASRAFCPAPPRPPPTASPPQLLPAPPSRRAATAATAPGHPRPRSVEPHAGTCPHLPVSAAPALSVLLLGPSHPPQDRSPRHHLGADPPVPLLLHPGLAAATRATTFEGESGHGDTRPRPYPAEASRFTRSECWSHAALLDSSPCPSPYLPFALPLRTERKMLFP